MPKKDTANSVKPHTEAKLQLYIKYLDIYLAVLTRAKGVTKINIYDMFCGEGLYDDGKTGSAIRAVEAIWSAVRTSNKEVAVNLLLNDLNKDKIQKLESILSARKSEEHGIDIKFSSYEAGELLNRLSERFQSQEKNIRNLVFIDPYGYKQISYSVLEKLLRNGLTEIILFLPIEQMYRFLGKVDDEIIDKSYLPLKMFVDQFGLSSEKINSEKEMIAAVSESLKFGGKYSTTCYSIKNHTGHYYGLFFVTNNLYGLEKIIEVKWKLDTQQGEGFTGSLQGDLLLEFEKLHTLKQIVIDRMRNGSVSNFYLYELTINAGFLPKHINGILSELQREGRLDVYNKSKNATAKKGAFKINYENWRDRRDEYDISLKKGFKQ